MQSLLFPKQIYSLLQIYLPVQILELEPTTKASCGIVRFCPIVIHKDVSKAIIAKKGTAKFSNIRRCFTNSTSSYRNFQDYSNVRYSSSVNSSIPMAVAISIALFSGLCSSLDSSASRS